MISSVTLLAAVLVSLQFAVTSAQVDHGNDLDNNIKPINSGPPPRRVFRNYVHIKESPPATVRLAPGASTVLTCDIIGKPAPSVQWLKNGEPLDDIEEGNNLVIQSDESSIVNLVSKFVVTGATSGDVYTCVATSIDLFTETASTTVFVEEDNEEDSFLLLQKLRHQSSKPIITAYYYTVMQTMGTDLIMPCRVHSDSKVDIIWELNHKMVYGNPRMRVLPSGDLLVSNLKWSDMGNFTCIARNAYGQDVATTFAYPIALSCEIKLSIPRYPPIISMFLLFSSLRVT